MAKAPGKLKSPSRHPSRNSQLCQSCILVTVKSSVSDRVDFSFRATSLASVDTSAAHAVNVLNVMIMKIRCSFSLLTLLSLLFLSSDSVFADEKATSLQTALTATTISGYVDTSAQWNFDTEGQNGFRSWLRA